MAEVLKHGKSYNTFDCAQCGATVGYSAADVSQIASVDVIDGKPHKFEKAIVRCPECGTPETVYFNFEEVQTEEVDCDRE